MTARATALELAIDALVTYRITRLATQDTLTAPIREHIWRTRHARYPDQDPLAPALTLSYLVTCPHCASIYAAAAALLLRKIRPLRPLRPLLAAAAVTSLLNDTGLIKPEHP